MSAKQRGNRVQDMAASYKTPSRAFTYADYLLLPDNGHRYQILRGELIMSPAPETVHQRISLKLIFAIGRFLEGHPIAQLLHAPVDVVLSEVNVLQPDIVIIRNERQSIIKEANIQGAPDWVIEILSPSTETYDRQTKKEIYAEFGVKEYWIVHPNEQWIEKCVLKDAGFETTAMLERTGQLNADCLPGFTLTWQDVFPVEVK
ncbi:MAG: Uma2 family endonuclease [candidate division KSB1 bacterium]|nr:Uma2 family endonuclease [candidate division KSB1 bacterium]